MSASKLLDTVSELTSQLGSIDSEVANIRWQLKSFYGELDGEDTLLAVPADFNPDESRKRLDNLLRERISVKAKLADAEAAHEQARNAEMTKLRADLTLRYKATVKAMLSAAIEFSKAIRECEGLREEARQAFGGQIGFLAFVGPPADRWQLTDTSSWPAHWVREAVAAGFIDRADKALADVKV